MSLFTSLFSIVSAGATAAIAFYVSRGLALGLGAMMASLSVAAGTLWGLRTWDRKAKAMLVDKHPFDVEKLAQDAFDRDVETLIRLPISETEREKLVLARAQEYQQQLDRLRADWMPGPARSLTSVSQPTSTQWHHAPLEGALTVAK